MTRISSILTGILSATVLLTPAFAQEKPRNKAPAGCTSLFDGQDLSGWRGEKGDYSPHIQATLTPEQLSAMQTQWNADRDMHWSVDKEKHEIVSDGHGVFLATDKNYGEFELYVDWVLVNDKQSVDGAVLDNYFDRSIPVLPTGPIELQTHGSEIRFRNIYIREI